MDIFWLFSNLLIPFDKKKKGLFHVIQVLQEPTEDLTRTLPMGVVHSSADDDEQVCHPCQQFLMMLPNSCLLMSA